ncbi:peptidoglycan recognition protein 4-like [Ischnura elegans]|uniref:peptidoglycan recognition protein 4-like n=1 Tax=Ischnura elegans TaxID=197161 RepID=UPI001ED8A628|nr:peptidoglycan recognition protein 4-like [Ischnura elegans]
MSLLVVAALAWAIGLPQFGTHSTILAAAEDPSSLTEDNPIKLDASYNTDFKYVEYGDVYATTHHEAERFHKLDCYEKVEKPDRLHSRRDWEWDEDELALESPVDVVVLRDGGHYLFNCQGRLECRATLRLIKGRREACDLRENFYVGNDGNVYEGRGWHVAPYGHLLGLRRHAITVRFLSYTSPPALQAYAMLIKFGVWKGHLSRDYKVIAMGRLLNDSRFSSDGLVKTVEGWERRTDVARLSTRWEFVVPHRLTLIFREEWNGSTPNGIQSRPPKNVELVMISESGEGCSSRAECSAWIKRYQDERIRADGDLEHNFYITEEGEVFEGLGWDSGAYSELNGITEDYVSIQLCGKFTSIPPSRKAINSLKLLVASGVELGMIRLDYRLLPSSLGSAFQKYAEGWSVRPDRI